jgi:hypothetical protein
MKGTIDGVASLGEIPRNPYMHDTLATGVEHNMDAIFEHVNDDWDDRSSDVTQEFRNTYQFFYHLMGYDDAAQHAWMTIDDWSQEEISNIMANEYENIELERLARVQGLVARAHGDAGIGAAQDQISLQEQRASMIDFGLGIIPYDLTVLNSDHAAGQTVGETVFSSDYSQLDQANDDAVELLVSSQLNNAGMIAAAAHQHGQVRAPSSLVDDEGQLLPLDDLQDSDEIDTFTDWVLSNDVMGNDYQGAMRDEWNAMKAGMLDAGLASLDS